LQIKNKKKVEEGEGVEEGVGDKIGIKVTVVIKVEKEMETCNVYSTGKGKCRTDRKELRREMEERRNERER
jgi:hypothetical protein